MSLCGESTKRATLTLRSDVFTEFGGVVIEDIHSGLSLTGGIQTARIFNFEQSNLNSE